MTEIVGEVVILLVERREIGLTRERKRIVKQTPLALKASKIKENNAISHLTDDNIILYPLLPSDTLDQ